MYLCASKTIFFSFAKDKKTPMKISKTKYLHTFALVTVLLALARCAAESPLFTESPAAGGSGSLSVAQSDDDSLRTMSQPPAKEVVMTADSGFVPHRILSVPSFKTTFPDSNSVQLQSAERYGVPAVRNRADAEKRKRELVYVAANPYFHVDPLRESIPYLVPRASVLLQDIGRAFYDSLYIKGVPLHQIIVTSVLRTEEDVARLRKHNGNASENSCHRFGTTFDICYNRYVTVQTAAQPMRQVRNDTLKWVLSEVLRDMRQSERCYVKYEVKQGCFHITVR